MQTERHAHSLPSPLPPAGEGVDATPHVPHIRTGAAPKTLPSPAGERRLLPQGDMLEEMLPSPAGGRGVGGEGASLLDRAKFLRTHQTDAEQRLWFHLRAHRFMGLKFKRQKPVGPYIADFVCHEPRLVIELDGGQHADQLAYDRKRDAFLQTQGFVVLRFWNNQVLSETDAVLEAIRLQVLALTTLSPNPSPASGRGELQRSTKSFPESPPGADKP